MTPHGDHMTGSHDPGDRAAHLFFRECDELRGEDKVFERLVPLLEAVGLLEVEVPMCACVCVQRYSMK